MASPSSRRRPFDPARLFARPRARVVPYPTRAAALDAVRRGDKAVVMTTIASVGDRDFARFVRDALARDLAVVLRARTPAAAPDLYALALDETWRIRALETLWSSTTAWSDSAEAQQSALLGYTPAQRAAWLAQYRYHQAAWGAATVYALVDAAAIDALDALGRRCFGALEVELVRPRAGYALRDDAARRVPRGVRLARVALDWDVADAVFARGGRGGVERARVAGRAINASLRGNVELLGARGWS